jgi:type II restriction enzyme
MKIRVTAENLAKAINGLPRDQWFEYIDPKTKTQAKIVSVTLPVGPIEVERKNKEGEIETVTISANVLWRVANAIEKGIPFQLDRILGASYNSRSLLEMLIARTPEFYVCRPGRIEGHGSVEAIKKGHKHLVWVPEKPHTLGTLQEYAVSNDLVIVETSRAVVYDSVQIDVDRIDSEEQLDEGALRRHIQIQVSLYEIGEHFGYRTWIAANDQHHRYRDGTIRDLPMITRSLSDEKVLAAYPEAQRKAGLIDLIWFSDRTIPMVVEVEHSTGVTSGLQRMHSFALEAPALSGMRYVVVAPDDQRDSVVRKAADATFADMREQLWYFPYSSVEELLDLCRRRDISSNSVSPEKFVELFMERIELEGAR